MGWPAPVRVRVRRNRQARNEAEVVAAVLAALTDGPMTFHSLRLALHEHPAILARTVGYLAVRGVVEQAGMPARWRLTGRRNGNGT